MALGPDKALLAGFGNSALSAGNSFFFPICQGENLAQANGLPFSGCQDAGSGNQALTDGRLSPFALKVDKSIQCLHYLGRSKDSVVAVTLGFHKLRAGREPDQPVAFAVIYDAIVLVIDQQGFLV